MLKPKFTGRFGKTTSDVQQQQAATQAPIEDAPPTKQPETPIVENEDAQAPVNTVQPHNQEPKSDEVEPNTQVEPKKDVTGQDEAPTVNESQVLEFLNKQNGTSFTTMAEVNASKSNTESTKVPEIDEQTQKFLKYQSKTNGTMQEFMELQKDWTKVDDIDILRSRESEESGMNLTQDQADLLIKSRYGLDEDDELDDLSNMKELEIQRDASKLKSEKITSNQEVLKSLEATDENAKEEPSGPIGETVSLSNGQVVDKAEYIKLRSEYLAERAADVEKLKGTEISFKFQDKDGEKTQNMSIEYTQEDKQRMLSMSEDTGSLMQQFSDATGKLNHSEFNEALLWANKESRESLLRRLGVNLFSSGVDSQLKDDKNINYSSTNTKQGRKSPKEVSNVRQSLNNANGGGIRPKFSLNR